MKVAPVMGGVIMNQSTWKRIPPEYQQKLMAICAKLETNNDSAVAGMEKQALDAMTQNGLHINQITPAEQQQWEDVAAKEIPGLTTGDNPTIDPALYQRIKDLLQQYRTSHGQ
jgi:TRAP-type C4-dicarboxylate transport system substrate-binding protein